MILVFYPSQLDLSLHHVPYHRSLSPLPSNLLLFIFSVAHAYFCLIVACQTIVLQPSKAKTRFIFVISCQSLRRLKRRITSQPPFFSSSQSHPPLIYCVSHFWLVVVCLSIVWQPSTTTEYIFSLIFLRRSISCPKRRGNVLPKRFALIA